MRFVLFVAFSCLACQAITNENPAPNFQPIPNPASIGIVGDTADVMVSTTPGIVLMGGSTDVDAAFKWMIQRAKGGDVMVIRASGSTGYNNYIYQDLGGVNSVETLLINTRELALKPEVAARIRQAELLFIAGGDQGNYVKFWKDTPVETALNYLINDKKVPIGGTSAGCAILGEITYTALNGTVNSAEALANPFDSRITLNKGDFIDVPFLKNAITDTHYDARERQGRHVAFLARMVQDWKLNARGIGVSEKTAVCIDENGMATVFGKGIAYFLQASTATSPETCAEKQPLQWKRDKKAVSVYEVEGTTEGNGQVDLTEKTANRGGKTQFWFVENGTLLEN